MSPFWRARFGAIFGKLLVNLLLAACITLGLGGSDDWLSFMISGMPGFVTPGVVRLGLLLIASVGLLLEWRLPVQNAIAHRSARARRSASIGLAVACCSPFIVGAFYLTANSTPRNPERHLTKEQKQRLASSFANLDEI